MTEGILLIDKPHGWTSFDVVNKIRRVVAEHEGKKPKSIKVGHTGTLDPFATGLLVVLIGKKYTKIAQIYSADHKTYQFEAKCGEQSSTGDPEGEITPCAINEAPTSITQEQLQKVLNGRVGWTEQTPPAYSAIKIDGKRAYALARSGKNVDIPPRKIEVSSLTLESFDFPFFTALTEVSKGTYIRVLVEDICKDLGMCGYTTKLRRIKAGQFTIDEAVKITKDLTIENIQNNLHPL